MFASAPTATLTPWRPTPAIWTALAVHVIALALVLVVPARWPYALALIIAAHLALIGAGLWPRSRWLGPNLSRLPAAAVARGEVVLSFDDGPDPAVTPRVQVLLDQAGVKASFFCVGDRAAAAPDCVQALVRSGHDVENHSDRHSNFFAFSGYGAFRAELMRAQARLQHLSGRAPRFFRAPMGFRNPLLAPVLAVLGLQYVSWTRRGFDAVDGDAEAVFRRLTRNLGAGDILLLHDGHAARTADGEPVVLAVLPRLLSLLRSRGLRPVSLTQALAPQV